MTLPTIVFDTITLRVPPSGVVRVPGRYPHRFASMPSYWREITTISRYVCVPVLPPQHQGALLGRTESSWT